MDSENALTLVVEKYQIQQKRRYSMNFTSPDTVVERFF
jgi:hypothetical protein